MFGKTQYVGVEIAESAPDQEVKLSVSVLFFLSITVRWSSAIYE